ncbi:MAG: recombinase family protein [Dehalococcoidia bacterium]|nr:recombinase family protein [Dehalococcoidia bacterium]
MNAAGYLRDLPDLDTEEQRRLFVAACARAGMQPGAVFIEPVAGSDRESAAGAGGSAFRRMLRSVPVDERASTVLVVANFEVLGDRARDGARRYLQLATAGFRVVLADGRDPDAELVRRWDERGAGERRRERARAAMQTRALRGEAMGRPPFGYRVVTRHLEPDPAEAAIVREIFRACIEDGAGVRRIARRLNEAGHRTRRGRPWATASVRDILRNAAYTGTYRRLGVVVPGAHEALVGQTDFATAQRLLAARRTSPAVQRRRAYLLSGIARCGYCGNNLIGVRRTRRGAAVAAATAAIGPATEYVYYQCESRTNHGRCDYHTRRAGELEEAVRAQLASIGPDVELNGSAVQPAPGTGTRGNRRSRVRHLDEMIERRAMGQWTAEQLLRAAGPLVLEDLADEAAADDRGRTPVEALGTLVEQWDVLAFEQRRALLQQVVAGVEVTDGHVAVRLHGDASPAALTSPGSPASAAPPGG